MIAGTSTGGIIALALAHGMTARQALNIYLERGERIFPPAAALSKVSRMLRWVFKPKYDQAALKKELLRIFGDKVLDDAVTRLVIPSFEGRHGEPFLYKTPHHPDYQKDRHKKFAHVALHTTAAPSYYPGVEDDGYVMIDGGVWANNPVMNVLVDGLACFDLARENVRILSLGTGEATFTVDERARNGGIKDWAFMLSFNAAVRAQSRNALGQAYLLVGKNNVARIDVPESDAPIAMDDVQRSVRELPMVARSLVEGASHRAGLSRWRGRKIHPLPDDIASDRVFVLTGPSADDRRVRARPSASRRCQRPRTNCHHCPGHDWPPCRNWHLWPCGSWHALTQTSCSR